MPANSDTAGYTKQDKGKMDSKKKPPGAKAGSGGGGGAGQQWCSANDSTTHNDANFYQEGSPHPQKGGAFTTVVLGAHPSLVDDDEKPAFNASDDFDGGFLWMASNKDGSFCQTAAE